MKKDKTGEIIYNHQELKMWVKEYRTNKDIDVEFEDGFISYNRNYSDFKKRSIKNPNFKIKTNRKAKVKPIYKNKINTRNKKNNNYKVLDRTGESVVNNYGNTITIIKYTNARDVIVEFGDGYQTNTTYQCFKNKTVSSPYEKVMYNLGYMGEGKYYGYKNKISTPQYNCWHGMFYRCLDKKFKEKCKTYDECQITEKWFNFQEFGQWYDEHYYKVENERMSLDKDILIKGNKLYSPETCIFVPQRINMLFVKSNAKRTNLPIGVSYDEKLDKYVSRYSKIHNMKRISKYIGIFDTPIQAFNAYKFEKEKYIKEVAEDYKDQIPECLYIAMMNYKVEITD